MAAAMTSRERIVAALSVEEADNSKIRQLQEGPYRVGY